MIIGTQDYLRAADEKLTSKPVASEKAEAKPAKKAAKKKAAKADEAAE